MGQREYGLLFVVVALILFFLGQNPYLILIDSGVVVVLRYTVTQFKHVSAMIFAVGATAVLGSYLEVNHVILIFVFLFLLDVLSSRVTRHMQIMAEDASEKGGSLTFSVRIKEETFIIGCADIVFPSMLVVSALIHHSAVEALFSSIFALAELLLALSKEEVHAIPYASLGILGFFVGCFVHDPASCIEALKNLLSFLALGCTVELFY
jgi:presenilin-like A22 family membrane protease